jgi:hypothetical protein
MAASHRQFDVFDEDRYGLVPQRRDLAASIAYRLMFLAFVLLFVFGIWAGASQPGLATSEGSEEGVPISRFGQEADIAQVDRSLRDLNLDPKSYPDSATPTPTATLTLVPVSR